MSRRIIGQCATSNCRELEHLSTLLARGEEVDLTNLTNSQKMAVVVLQHFQKHEVPFEVLLKIREVLIWKYDNGGFAFEYKLLYRGDTKTREWLMKSGMGSSMK